MYRASTSVYRALTNYITLPNPNPDRDPNPNPKPVPSSNPNPDPNPDHYSCNHPLQQRTNSILLNLNFRELRGVKADLEESKREVKRLAPMENEVILGRGMG